MDKLSSLNKDLAKYQKILSRLLKEWSATREGSAYGSEYLEIQIKVYQDMILQIRSAIAQLKKP